MNYYRINNLMMFFKIFLPVLANLPSKAHNNGLDFSSLLNADLLSVKVTCEHLKEK